eukprot:2209320-Pyramimonas_sp.AAC.1
MPLAVVHVAARAHMLSTPCCDTSDTPSGVDHPFVKGPGGDSSKRGGNLARLQPRKGNRLPVGSHARRI